MKQKQVKSDAAISIMLKNKLVDMIDKAKDVTTVVAITNAFAKLRAVEIKADEGDFAQDLPSEVSPDEVRLPQ